MINNSPDGILAHLSEVILHSNHHLIVRRPDWISWGKPTDAPPKDFSLPMVRRVPRLGISDLAEFQNSPYTKQWVVNTNAFPSSEMWKTCRFKVWIWMKKMETWKVANVWDWENGENNYKASKISGKTIQLLDCFHQIRSLSGDAPKIRCNNSLKYWRHQQKGMETLQ